GTGRTQATLTVDGFDARLDDSFCRGYVLIGERVAKGHVGLGPICHEPSSEPTQTRVFRVRNAPKPPVGGPVWARGLRLTAGDQATGSEPPQPVRAEAAPSGIPRTLRTPYHYGVRASIVFNVPQARYAYSMGVLERH